MVVVVAVVRKSLVAVTSSQKQKSWGGSLFRLAGIYLLLDFVVHTAAFSASIIWVIVRFRARRRAARRALRFMKDCHPFADADVEFMLLVEFI
jgi:hypothetical protein